MVLTDHVGERPWTVAAIQRSGGLRHGMPSLETALPASPANLGIYGAGIGGVVDFRRISTKSDHRYRPRRPSMTQLAGATNRVAEKRVDRAPSFEAVPEG